MRKLAFWLMVAVSVAALPAFSAEPKQVVAYNSPPQWANWGSVLREFSKETGIAAPSDNKNSGQTLTALLTERARPVADVAYFGIVFGIQAADRGVLAPYKPPEWSQIPANLKDSSGRWFTVHYGAVAFLINTEALGGTPVPKSWADLLRPAYRGKVAFLDPTSAAIGYSVVTAANLALGGTLDNWDPGFAYLKKLEAQGTQHPKQTSTARLVKGEIPILIDADFNGYQAKYGEGAPIDVVIPAEGSLKIPYVIGLAKNAPHPANGKRLLDFVLSDAGQALWAAGYVHPIRNVKIPADVAKRLPPASVYAKVKDVDFKKLMDRQQAVVNRWISQIERR